MLAFVVTRIIIVDYDVILIGGDYKSKYNFIWKKITKQTLTYNDFFIIKRV